MAEALRGVARALRVRGQAPDLLAACGADDVELDDGTVVNAYKHRWTRRYLHLSRDGRAFSYAYDCGYEKDCYARIDAYIAIAVAFERWESCTPTSDEEQALRSAVQRALTAAS